MHIIEPDNPARITHMRELVALLSQATTPQQVLHAFAEGWRKLSGKMAYISLSCEGLKPGAYRITRQLTEDQTSQIATADPWKAPHEIPIHRGGILGWIVERGEPVIVVDPDLDDDLVLGNAMAGYCVIRAVPLYHQGRIGHWAISLSRDPNAFKSTPLEDALLRSNLVGSTVRQVRMTQQLRQANEKIRNEVSKIAAIQQALLPHELPKIPGLTLAAKYETFDQAGGDLYHVQPLNVTGTPGTPEPADATRWRFVIADVSGHGPAAAVVMAMVYSILMTYPHPPEGPGEVLTYLNQHLCGKRIDDTFVTASVSIYDTANRQFTYASAGHPPPLWRKPLKNRKSTEIEQLNRVGGLPLGIMETETYGDASVQFDPWQTLTLYTDGIPETRNPQGEFFGIEGIQHALADCSGEADCLVETLHRHVRRHEAGQRPQDDQTVLAIHVEP